ncbi:MAG: hypothetical protein K6A14_07890 [Erysipelotrichaceae bacterium]|nr:hypothetical protein [Erysipelotrichaceae bacterium]
MMEGIEGLFMVIMGALCMLYGVLVKANPQRYLTKKFRDDEKKIQQLENSWAWFVILGAITVILGIL